MATIHKEITIEAAPDAVWAAVRDVGAVHERLVPGLVVATTLDGDVRTVTFANGMTVREQIVTIDDGARRLVYAATGGRATHHNASLQVVPEGLQKSRLVWITDLLPAEAAGPVGALVEQGASIMKATLERGASAAARPAHRWYPRPVFFVADVQRAARFYVESLGFEKGWHEGDGAGKVCQVNHGECEIILCEDATRRDRSRLFIELTAEGLADLRRALVARAVPTRETWWGYETLQVDDPDGNELLFPRPD